MYAAFRVGCGISMILKKIACHLTGIFTVKVRLFAILVCVCLYHTEARAYTELRCEAVGYQMTNEIIESIQQTVSMMVYAAQSERMPWDYEALYANYYCSSSAYNRSLTIRDPSGNTLELAVDSLIMGSMPLGQQSHQLCIDFRADRVFRPSNGRCF